jgi:hypothetical protein
LESFIKMADWGNIFIVTWFLFLASLSHLVAFITGDQREDDDKMGDPMSYSSAPGVCHNAHLLQTFAHAQSNQCDVYFDVI